MSVRSYPVGTEYWRDPGESSGLRGLLGKHQNTDGLYMTLSINVIRSIVIKRVCKRSNCFIKQDALVYILYCNSPLLSRIPNSLLPLRFVRCDILLAHFKGIKCLPPLPPLPYPQEATLWLPVENSSVALAAHFKADQKSFHSRIETSQRQHGSRAPQESGGCWCGRAQQDPSRLPLPMEIWTPHSGRRTVKCLNLKCVWRGRCTTETHAGFPGLSTAASGRCLIKASAISLACSVIPFCKQIWWENILALGNLVLKKLCLPSSLFCPAQKRAEALCTHPKVSDLPPCSKQYFSFHFIKKCNYPFAFKAWVFSFNLIQVLNLGVLFLFIEDNSLPNSCHPSDSTHLAMLSAYSKCKCYIFLMMGKAFTRHRNNLRNVCLCMCVCV